MNSICRDDRRGGVHRTPPFSCGSLLTRFRFMLLLVIMAMVFGGCSSSPLLQNPTVTLDSLRVIGAGSEGLDLAVDLQVHNPNLFPITVRGYRYALTVTGLPFGSGRELQEVTLVSQAATRVQIPVRIPFSAILQLLENRLDPDAIPYGLEAVLELSTPFGAQRLPVKSTGLFSVPAEYRPDKFLQQLHRLIPGLQSHLRGGI